MFYLLIIVVFWHTLLTKLLGLIETDLFRIFSSKYNVLILCLEIWYC